MKLSHSASRFLASSLLLLSACATPGDQRVEADAAARRAAVAEELERKEREAKEAGTDEVLRFGIEIQARIARLAEERGNNAYPRVARQRGWEGTTIVRVEFGLGGQGQAMDVFSSSGYEILDQRAIELVREVLPPVPRELQHRAFALRLPVMFKLASSSAESASGAKDGTVEIPPRSP